MSKRITFSKKQLQPLIILLSIFGCVLNANAHPHILIDANVALNINAQNSLTKLSYTWQFDENFSLLLLGDYDSDNDNDLNYEELTTLVNETLEGALELGYFTHLKNGETQIKLHTASQVLAKLDANRLTFQFDLDLAKPQKITPNLSFSLFDEEYYAAFIIDDKIGYKLISPTNSQCKIVPTKIAKTDDNIQAALENAFNQDTINRGFGSQFAHIIGIKC